MDTCNLSPRRLILLTTDQDEKLRDISLTETKKRMPDTLNVTFRARARVCVRVCVCVCVCVCVFNIATAGYYKLEARDSSEEVDIFTLS